MKPPILLAGLIFALVPAAAAEAAPYIGLDLGEASIDFNNSASTLYSQSVAGFEFHVGERFEGFAAELGYGTMNKNGNTTIDNMRLDKLTADAIYYLPVFGRISLLLTAGVDEVSYGASTYSTTQYQSNGIYKTSRDDMSVLSGNGFDWRAGAGFSFPIFDDFELHFVGRYEPLKMGGQANYTLSTEVGIDYYF